VQRNEVTENPFQGKSTYLTVIISALKPLLVHVPVLEDFAILTLDDEFMRSEPLHVKAVTVRTGESCVTRHGNKRP
jgi:Ni2+-binding GTPase involved in maturation of urease and hydrogenase